MFNDSDYTNKPGEGGGAGSSGNTGDDRFYSYDLSSADDSGPIAGDIPEPAPERTLDTGDESFKINFDFDGEYRDIPDRRPLRQRRERRTGCLGGIMYSVFIICVSLLIASLGWMAATDVLGFGSADEEVAITVPKDYEISDIADILHENGLISYKFLFQLYAGFSKAENYIAPGSYTLNKNFDYRALVHGMSARSETRVQVTVTIPEGYTMSEIFTLLEKSNVCSADELWNAAKNYDFDYEFLNSKTVGKDKYRLEGYLFPDTYKFYVSSTPQQAISKFLDGFERKFTKEFVTRAEEIGYSMHDIIIIASMIERETGTAEGERENIASVIYNRLNSSEFPHLQIDATIYYAMQVTGKPFSRDLDSPYNTDVCVGLPAGPISNPGIASIRAALYPEETKFYYYALAKDGGHHQFFKTYAEHVAFVASDEYGG